ncbi:MAG: metallophosphoesterase [Gemmatimonadetes bacterium]|nr:metallophosphoesterase [Gemmatimonadota bacterium]
MTGRKLVQHLAGWRCLAAVLLLTHPAFAQGPVSGVVFADRDGNGRRDAGEPGIERAWVSNQVDVSASDASGAFTLPGGGNGVVFVSVPDGYRVVGSFWRAVTPETAAAPITFGLQPAARVEEFTFIHASDTHIQASAVPRFDRLRAVVDSMKPAFVLISGDLVRDALRVGEAEARGYYELYVRESARLTAPAWNVPGNHEIFGIERHLSLVAPTHPLYGRKMYRSYLGPDYYSFTYGGVHFVGLNTVDIADLFYYGHVDSTQLVWLERDLAGVPPATPVVTFNHIPFFSSALALGGYTEDPPAPTLIRVNGRDQFRHVVSNARDVLAVLRDRPYPLALGGHFHMRERLEYGTEGGRRTRFEQTAAVVGPSGSEGMRMASGVTVYRVRRGEVSVGEFIPLDPRDGSRH